jgi:hypothetical protein
MTGRAAALQGGLAALRRGGGDRTWQREPERAPGEAAVIEAAKSDVTRVRYEDADNILAIERRTEGGEPLAWVHLEEKPHASAPAKPGDPPTPPTPPATPPRDLRGNPDALKLVERFAPLVSPRSFGVMEKAKLAELGLDTPTRHLEMTIRGDVHKYDIGIALHAQNGEAFLRDARDGRVYLMPRGMLNELGNGKRLVDLRLHVFESREFDRVTVTVGGKKKEFVHLGRENFSTEGYAPAKTPDKRDQMAKNWHDMVWRTFPMEVYGKDEVPKGDGKLTSMVRLEYSEKGHPVGWLEIARLGEPNSTVPGANVTDRLYARSEHTVGWARLHSPDDLVTDAEKIITAP